MAKIKKCKWCGAEGKLWFASPPTCVRHSCRAQGDAERKAQKGEIPKPYKSPIKQLSDSRAKDYSLYRPVRDKYMKEHPICECCNVKPATDLHHKAGKIGKLLYNPEYFCALCRWCHNYITENSAWAIEKGYSLTRLDK